MKSQSLPTESETFEKEGFLVRRQVYSENQLDRIRTLIKQPTPHIAWEKDLCARSYDYLKFADLPSICDTVCDLLGEHVILWGGIVLERNPNEVHPWHTDIESSAPEGGFVSVWVGIDGIQRESVLKVVPGSHRFGQSIQQVIQDHGEDRKTATDANIETWAKTLDAASPGVTQPDIQSGDAIFFDGRIWHGSENLAGDSVRRAVLFQFARADAAVRIPNFKNLEWPFKFRDRPLPPCIQISGKADRKLNKISDKPPEIKSDLPQLASETFQIDLDKQLEGEKHFIPTPLFTGCTDNLKRIACHYSVLKPGRSPHVPHAHVDEEILVVLRGSATLLYENNQGKIIEYSVKQGGAVYYPSFHRHTIRNDDKEPILYVMLKWVGQGNQAKKKLSLQTFDVTPTGKLKQEKRFTSSQCFKAPTNHLKGIETHISTLLPGGGYKAHTDDHDVAILMFEGSVVTNGQTITHGQLVWHSAGTDHDMRNHSEKPARYLVIEFHGPNCPGDYSDFYTPVANNQPKAGGLQTLAQKMKQLVGLN